MRLKKLCWDVGGGGGGVSKYHGLNKIFLLGIN